MLRMLRREEFSFGSFVVAGVLAEAVASALLGIRGALATGVMLVTLGLSLLIFRGFWHLPKAESAGGRRERVSFASLFAWSMLLIWAAIMFVFSCKGMLCALE